MWKTVADTCNPDLGSLVYGNAECLRGGHNDLEARLPNEPLKLHGMKLSISAFVGSKESVNCFSDTAKYELAPQIAVADFLDVCGELGLFNLAFQLIELVNNENRLS